MNYISCMSDLIDEPRKFIDEGGASLGIASFLGYCVGAFSIFTFLRLYSAVPPGVYSFANVLIAALAVNFFLAAAMHLFLEMTGAKGGAVKLFLLFGFTELFWSLLLPLGLLTKAGYMNPLFDLILCFVFVVMARAALIKRLYDVSKNKALLAILLPYVAVAAGGFMAFVYGIVYLVWLVS